MFCIHCGANIPDNARFCSSCGKETVKSNIAEKTNEIPATGSNETGRIFSVTFQGFSPDLNIVNGSYDSVEKKISSEELIKLLSALKKLPASGTNTNEDLCPPSFVINIGDHIHAFCFENGDIIYSNTNERVSESDVVKIISGENYELKELDADSTGRKESRKNPMVWGSGHKDIAGLTPIRKKDLPPTDRINTDSSTIRYKDSPKISEKVLKSSHSGKLHIPLILFGILAIVLMLGGFAVQEAGLAVISLLAAIVLFILAGYVKGKARGMVYMGFDWTTNTIWTIFPGEKLSWLGNANCITRFSIEKSQITSSRIQNIGSSDTRIYATVKDKINLFQIMAEKTDGSVIPVCKLYSQQDATNVLNKINHLLNAQGN